MSHFFFFQAEDGIRDLVRSRGLGDVYKRQYHDKAVGTMARDARGKLAITTVTLRPDVRFSGERLPTPEEITAMHLSLIHI